ncbi:MAG: HAD-IA family hydrolase [Anaerolineaceae bacterium]
MIKLLIFDFDGVLRLWDDDIIYAKEQLLGIPQRTLFEIAFSPELGEAVVSGRISNAVWRKAIRAELEARYGSRGLELSDLWDARTGTIDEQVRALVEFLKHLGYRVVMLTNGTSTLREELRHLGVDKLYHHVYNTAEVGVFKPNAAIFEHIRQAEKIPFHQMVFVDDNAANIAAAHALGLHTHHYHNLEELRHFLGNLRVL